MGAHALRRHLAQQEIVGLAIGGKDGNVGFIALVAGTRMHKLYQLSFHDSSTLTRTYSSMMSRGASVGQMPSNPRGSIIPPAPPMNGGPLSARGGKRRPSFAASRRSLQRIAMRK